jgi:uridine phosphorylase
MENIFSAKRPVTGKGRMYHIRVAPKEVGRYVLLTGDPDRVKIIAEYLDDSQIISEHREFTVHNGYVEGELVTICSTGIGGPSTAIALEELAECGARTFIRVGSCGAIQDNINLGDLIIVTSAVRLDGTSKTYIFPEYPAVASYEVLEALIKTCVKGKYRHHIGIAASTDSFYVGQSRPGFKNYLPRKSAELVNVLKKVNVLCFEMETSTLFTLASMYHLRAGYILTAFANRITDEFEVRGEEESSKVAVESIGRLIRENL